MTARALRSLLIACCCCAAGDAADLKALYDAHQWFRLRDAVEDGNAPLFYRAVVACVFNHAGDCEKLMRDFLQSAPPAAREEEARDFLFHLYWRSGRFAPALAQVETELARNPKADPGNMAAMCRAFLRHSELAVARRRDSTVHVLYKNAFIPVTINGIPFHSFVDTGANISLVTESAARRLGLATTEISGAGMADASNTGVGIQQVAVAERLTIGGMQLTNVPFFVVSDRTQPFVGWKPGNRAMLGIQVLLACRTMRWKGFFPRAGFELGAAPGARNIRAANLCFDGMIPVVQAELDERKLSMVVDTGAGRSVMHAGFARQFAPLLDGVGRKGTKSFLGMGGQATVETTTLPRLTMSFGGTAASFRRLDVYLKGPQSEWQDGLLGTDFLNKARAVTIDFEAMTLRLK